MITDEPIYSITSKITTIPKYSHAKGIKLAQSGLFEPFVHRLFCFRLIIGAISQNSRFAPWLYLQEYAYDFA